MIKAEKEPKLRQTQYIPESVYMLNIQCKSQFPETVA